MMERILTSWSFYPSVFGSAIVMVVLYLVVTHFHPQRRFIWFLLGTVTMVLALVSPLDILSDTYLFSAHMIQHLLLDLVIPPLLLIGLPSEPIRGLLERPLPNQVENLLGRPLVAWLLGIGTLWIWHLPVLYDATLRNEQVHVFEHLCFLVTGVIFWWPVIVPAASRTLNTFYALAYLFTGALANSLLGIILTFAPHVIYRGYQNPDDVLGILPLLRNTLGLSPIADQQLGGVLMWVVGGLIFLTAMLGVLTRWYNAPKEEHIGLHSQGLLLKKGG